MVMKDNTELLPGLLAQLSLKYNIDISTFSNEDELSLDAAFKWLLDLGIIEPNQYQEIYEVLI
jgi:hypothetical protein